MPPPSTRWHGLGAVAAGVASAGLVWAVLAPALLPLVHGLERLLRGQWAIGLLLTVVGVAVLGLVGVLLARPLTQRDARRAGRLDVPRGWWDARSLAWLGVTVTLRSAVAGLVVLLTLAAGATLFAPWLVLRGDRLDLGPWRITTLPMAGLAAGLGLVILILEVLRAPRLALLDRRLLDAVIGPDQQQLKAELVQTTTSRARLVSAFDLERRRIERDLHDGIQPELLGVSMSLGLALASMAPDDPARALVATAHQQSLEVVDHLRRFVRGIHPQVLDDHGLGAALTELAGTLPVQVTLDDRLDARPDPDIEAALYYACAELLSNVVKHADAQSVHVTLADVAGESGGATATVSDDGRGGADPHGHGLIGVRDRMEALGGRLSIHSPKGGPTSVTLDLPREAR